VFEIR